MKRKTYNRFLNMASIICIIVMVLAIIQLLVGCGSNGALLFKQIPGPQGEQGAQGEQGERGESGQNGQDGLGCTTFNVPGGAIIQCADGSSSIISDGQPGSSIEILNPCGDMDRQDEVFLRFIDANGTLTVIAFFTSNGSALFSRLSVLKCDGQTEYVTTDGQRCEFKLDSACNLIDEELKKE